MFPPIRGWLDMVRRLDKCTLTRRTSIRPPSTDHLRSGESSPCENLTVNEQKSEPKLENSEKAEKEYDKWEYANRTHNYKFKWSYLIPGWPFYVAWRCLRADENFSFFRWLGTGLFAEFLKILSYASILMGLYAHFSNISRRDNILSLGIVVVGLIFYPIFSWTAQIWVETNYHGKNPFYFP